MTICRIDGQKNTPIFFSTFVKIGGLCVQYLVANAEELKDAKKNPDRYPDLLVRVGGYSALFTRLSADLQDAIIERVEQTL